MGRAYGFMQKKPWESQKWSRTYAHFLFHRDHPENVERIKRRNSMDFNRKNIFTKQGMKNQESESILQSCFNNTETKFSKEGEQDNDSFDSVLQLSLKLRDECSVSLSSWNAEDETLSSLSIEKDATNRTISLGSLFDVMQDPWEAS